MALLAPDTVIETPRLRLTPLSLDVYAGLSAWLEAALAPEWTLADIETAVGADNGVLISDTDGAAIGVAVVLENAPAVGCATIAFLAVDPARRFRGLGGEAGLALDRYLRERGMQKVYVPVPDGRGLAVYFWLRLGFRPLTTSTVEALKAPWPPLGLTSESKPGIWMLRDTE